MLTNFFFLHSANINQFCRTFGISDTWRMLVNSVVRHLFINDLFPRRGGNSDFIAELLKAQKLDDIDDGDIYQTVISWQFGNLGNCCGIVLELTKLVLNSCFTKYQFHVPTSEKPSTRNLNIFSRTWSSPRSQSAKFVRMPSATWRRITNSYISRNQTGNSWNRLGVNIYSNLCISCSAAGNHGSLTCLKMNQLITTQSQWSAHL